MTTSAPLQGGGFLLTPAGERDQFIPEELSDELLQLRSTAKDFIEGEVLPRDADIEAKKPGVLATLLRKAGELGFLMVEIPEEYGGLGIGKVAATVVAESCIGQGSFTAALMCHSGIATMPILYYGTPEQKKKYLTKLASGEMLGAYALTEAQSGSDALAARTKAVLTPDGKYYLLNGEKQFITNGGFADLYTVFAKVDGEKFSGFLVERTMQGVSQGPEEKKLGMHGSSTVPLILQDAKIPVENLLGEVGRGHKIAFQTLNIGRWKLAAAAAGDAKRLVGVVTKYTRERQQFGKALADFELMKQKIAEFGIKAFLAESIVYRYAGDLDTVNATVDMTKPDAYRERGKLSEEFAIEASITKVFCSEVLFELCDDAVQMFGGYGYLQEYQPERAYRDNRINRIWEGTNEINRFLIPGTLLKRMAKGTLNLVDPLTQILEQLRAGFPTVDAGAPFAACQDRVSQLKRLVIYLGGVAVNTCGPQIQERQQILADLADVIIAAYVADSAMSRVLKLQQRNAKQAEIPALMLQCYLARRLPELKVAAQRLLADVVDGNPESYIPYGKALDRLCPYLPFNLTKARNQIAEVLTARGEYAW